MHVREQMLQVSPPHLVWGVNMVDGRIRQEGGGHTLHKEWSSLVSEAQVCYSTNKN